MEDLDKIDLRDLLSSRIVSIGFEGAEVSGIRSVNPIEGGPIKPGAVMGERETIRSGSAAWAGTVALALGAAASQGSPASASTVVTGSSGGDVTVTPVGVDLTSYSQLSPYVVNFKGSPAFDVYYAKTGYFEGYQYYPIVGVNSGDLTNIGRDTPGATVATKLPAGVTIDRAIFTNPNTTASIKTPTGTASPFYVPLEVVTGHDRYYGWAEFSDGDLTLNSYAFANTPVPEPSTWTLLALGAAGVLVIRRRSRSLAQARAR